MKVYKEVYVMFGDNIDISFINKEARIGWELITIRGDYGVFATEEKNRALQIAALIKTDICDLELSTRVSNVLTCRHIKTVEDLFIKAECSLDRYILTIESLGRKSYNEIQDSLKYLGCTFEDYKRYIKGDCA